MAKEVVLLYGSASFTFGWRDGIEPSEFQKQLQGAVRGATGRQSLQGLKLFAEEPPRDGKPGPAAVTPRDIFEHRAVGRIRIVGDDAPVSQAPTVPGYAPVTTVARGGVATTGGTPADARGIAAGRVGVGMRMTATEARNAACLAGPKRGAFQKKGGSTLQFVRLMQLDRDPAGLHGASPSRKLTMAEVARHSSKADAWTVLNGRVFNITPYMEYHPGGVDELMRSAGCDGTALFREIHPWVSVDMIDRLQVGVLDAQSLQVGAVDKALLIGEWRTFPLLSTKQMTPDTLLLRFALQNARQKSGLRTGQHLKVRVQVQRGSEVMKVERAYTPISATDAEGFIELLVKVYPCGKMGPALAALQPQTDATRGDTVEMQGPLGDLVYLGSARFELGTADLPSSRLVNASHVVMLAAGSGLTPMLQILRVMAAEWQWRGGGPRPTPCKATLIFCNRREEDIIMRQGLESLASDEPRFFKLCLVLSSPPRDSASWANASLSDTCIELPSRLAGHISDDLIASAFGSGDDSFHDVLALSCGPEGFNEAVSGAFKRMCVPADRVHVF